MKGFDNGGQRFELSKALEIINFRVLQENQLHNGKKEGSAKHWISDDTEQDDEGKNKVKNQFTSFQNAMKMVIIWGQCIGLNPVTGILQKDVSKMRFTKCSLKFLLALIMAITQTIATILCIYRLFRKPNNLSALGFVTFYTTSCLTTISFIRAAPKWPPLMRELTNCRLDEYIHPNIVKRCKIACAVCMGMGLMEHTMSVTARIARIVECEADVAVGEGLMRDTSPWLYKLNMPFIEWFGIIVQSLNLMTTATWNYADVFIVCISLYLTSIMEQINKKIVLTASQDYVPATTWSALREDYTRATNLVRLFDDVFSGLVLVAFANDLFFICLQLYNILVNGVKAELFNKLCPGHEDSVFRSYVYPAYLTYSTIFLFFRFLTVALVASRVNSSSSVPLPVLYAVPTTSYSKEVERFHNQVNGDTVALSGLHFFYITRDLVLTAQLLLLKDTKTEAKYEVLCPLDPVASSVKQAAFVLTAIYFLRATQPDFAQVAGTIVTYELVLLQFSNDDK